MLRRVSESSGNLRRYSSSPETSALREIGNESTNSLEDLKTWDEARGKKAATSNQIANIFIGLWFMFHVLHHNTMTWLLLLR